MPEKKYKYAIINIVLILNVDNFFDLIYKIYFAGNKQKIKKMHYAMDMEIYSIL